jgi:hypothetical protein
MFGDRPLSCRGLLIFVNHEFMQNERPGKFYKSVDYLRPAIQYYMKEAARTAAERRRKHNNGLIF